MFELRELERNDIPAINEWRRNRELISFLGAPYRFIGQEVDEEWFESYLKSRANTVRCAMVEHDRPDVILGLVTLASINWVSRKCTLHIMIGNEADRGKGLGTFAVDAAVSHAFLDLNLNRVELDVLESNSRARHLYQKIGFKEEGVRRCAAFKDGNYVDMVSMGLLHDEWMPSGGGR